MVRLPRTCVRQTQPTKLKRETSGASLVYLMEASLHRGSDSQIAFWQEVQEGTHQTLTVIAYDYRGWLFMPFDDCQPWSWHTKHDMLSWKAHANSDFPADQRVALEVAVEQFDDFYQQLIRHLND